MDKTMTDKKTESQPTADEKARTLREIGDAMIVYGEIEQNDEQRDVNQPEPDEHV
jgi:hypothetical protein